jgi:pyrophosphatase PpaX
VKLSDEQVVNRCFYRAFEDIVTEFNLPCAVRFGELIQEGLVVSIEKAKLFEGVIESLNVCAEHKIKLAVVTSAPRRVVEKALRILEIDSFFYTLVTADDVVNFKPHPEPVSLALRRLKSQPEETLMIGDSHVDIHAAKAAGVKIGLFHSEEHKQFYDFQKLKDSQPHFIFDHYDSLHEYLFTATKS